MLSLKIGPNFEDPIVTGSVVRSELWNNIQSKDPELVWMAEGVGNGYASVSVMKDRLYTTGNTKNNQVLFLRLAQGWQSSLVATN